MHAPHMDSRFTRGKKSRSRAIELCMHVTAMAQQWHNSLTLHSMAQQWHNSLTLPHTMPRHILFDIMHCHYWACLLSFFTRHAMAGKGIGKGAWQGQGQQSGQKGPSNDFATPGNHCPGRQFAEPVALTRAVGGF